jgi:hypothetical protein
MLLVFQVQLTDAMADEVNAAGSWSKVAWGKTYMDLTMGFLDDVTDNEVLELLRSAQAMGLTKLTRMIDTEDLDEAFAIGNGYGDQSKMTVFEPSKSLSVGDILVKANGAAHMVARFGFRELPVFEIKVGA